MATARSGMRALMFPEFRAERRLYRQSLEKRA
jgi:hypothetical protein